MKQDVVENIALCDTCQRVKVEHQRPVGFLQPLKIPEWKWDMASVAVSAPLTRGRRRGSARVGLAGHKAKWAEACS
jgi:hypothetical protein